MPLKGTQSKARVLLLPHTFRQDELLYSVLCFSVVLPDCSGSCVAVYQKSSAGLSTFQRLFAGFIAKCSCCLIPTAEVKWEIWEKGEPVTLVSPGCMFVLTVVNF